MHTDICLFVGDSNAIDINPFDFSPGEHMLTLVYIDERGITGTIQYNFTSQAREGEHQSSVKIRSDPEYF